MASKDESREEKAARVVDLVRRLQSFHLEDALAAATKAPPDAFQFRVTEWTAQGREYRTTKITLHSEKALKSFDLTSLKHTLSPQAYKAAYLLQRDMSFDPLVIAEAKNYLPTGMIDLAIGGEKVAMPPIGINLNFNCRAVAGRPYWPTIETAE
jgi:hypothetical protein